MSEFINTIDLLGDEAVTKAVIEKSIAEFNDDVLTSVGQYAFYNCTALARVEVPNVTSIGDCAFYKCTALTSVDIPLLKTLNKQVFRDCKALTNIHLPLVTKISSSAFMGCKSLVSVDLPSLTYVQSNDQQMFDGCISLKSVKFPLLQTVAVRMFYGCTSFESADFPNASVIDFYSFLDCTVFKTLILRSESMCSVSGIQAFSGTPFAEGGTGGRCLVPRSLIESYQTGTNWSSLYAAGTCTFLALEDYTIDGTITGEIDWDKLGGTT